MAERLGEVPVAVLEKGKQPGSHLLSGAVVEPAGRCAVSSATGFRMEDLPTFGPVPGESVYVLTRRAALPIPPPPPMRNHGNWIFSLSQLGRFLGEQAEEGGAMILPETSAQKLLVSHGRVVGVRTGDKGRGREGGELRQLRSRLRPRREGHGARGGDAGPSHRRGGRPLRPARRGPAGLGARREGGLEGREAARPRDPHDGLAAAHGQASTASSAARSSIRWARTWSRSASSSGLDYRDASLSVHDLLQELKTHPKIRKILAGGERVEWGAKTIPSGGFHSLPRKLHAPGLLLCGDGVGHGQHPAAQGHPLRDRVGTARGRGRVPRAAARRDAGERALVLRRRGARQLHLERPARGAEHAPGLRARLLRRRRARERDDGVEGPRRAREDAAPSRTPTSRCSSPIATRAIPAPDGKLTFDKLSSVFASGNKTRDDQPNHIRLERRVPRGRRASSGRTCARRRCTRSAPRRRDGTVTVEVAPSNCVQCGAITAKGGRLTPPEGGSGPEYTLDLIYRGFTRIAAREPDNAIHVHTAFRPSRSASSWRSTSPSGSQRPVSRFAMRSSQQLFGQNLIRADVVTKSGGLAARSRRDHLGGQLAADVAGGRRTRPVDPALRARPRSSAWAARLPLERLAAPLARARDVAGQRRGRFRGRRGSGSTARAVRLRAPTPILRP